MAELRVHDVWGVRGQLMESPGLLTDRRSREVSHLVLLRRIVKPLCDLEAKGRNHC